MHTHKHAHTHTRAHTHILPPICIHTYTQIWRIFSMSATGHTCLISISHPSCDELYDIHQSLTISGAGHCKKPLYLCGATLETRLVDTLLLSTGTATRRYTWFCSVSQSLAITGVVYSIERLRCYWKEHPCEASKAFVAKRTALGTVSPVVCWHHRGRW